MLTVELLIVRTEDFLQGRAGPVVLVVVVAEHIVAEERWRECARLRTDAACPTEHRLDVGAGDLGAADLGDRPRAHSGLGACFALFRDTQFRNNAISHKFSACGLIAAA